MYVYCDTHESAEYPAPIDQLVERDPAEHQSTMYQLDEHEAAKLRRIFKFHTQVVFESPVA
jgi:hypothetical protein